MPTLPLFCVKKSANIQYPPQIIHKLFATVVEFHVYEWYWRNIIFERVKLLANWTMSCGD